METFEFLNICQVHGFPKIMGVLTHLDRFKDNKKLQISKKRFKHRFWTEVYAVSKMLARILSTLIGGNFSAQIILIIYKGQNSEWIKLKAGAMTF